MRHTKGPWQVVEDIGDGGRQGWDITTKDQCIVGCEGIEAWQENSEANARLISCAPDLLEALEAMFDAFKYTSHNETEDAANELARATIAKATGGEG